MQAKEEFQLAELASETRIQEQKLAADQATLRREEEMEGARVARQRRDLTENFETEKQAGELEKQRLHAKLAAEEDRLTVEGPIRLLRIETERGILAEELVMRQLQNQVHLLNIERDLVLPRAQQEMRLALLPVENAPEIVEAASRVLHGTNLSIYGDGAEVLGQLGPLLGLVSRAVQQATPGAGESSPVPEVAEPVAAG